MSLSCGKRVNENGNAGQPKLSTWEIVQHMAN